MLRSMRWTPILTVPQQIAEMFQDMLWKEGIVSRLEPADAVSFLGISPAPCRILVRPDQAAAARAYLADVTGEEQVSDERKATN